MSHPYEVAHATNVIVNGQLVYGYSLGVKVRGVDAIIFAPTYGDMMRMAATLQGTVDVYGANRIKRCVMIDERQLTVTPIPVPEVTEVTMKAWDETKPKGL